MRMPQHVMKWGMLGTMLLTIPCFVFFGACYGFVPVGVLGLFVLVGLVHEASSDPFRMVMVVVFVGANAAVYVFVGYKLASLLARYRVRASQTWHILMLSAVIALAAVAMFSPIHLVECTHSGSTCTAFTMYVE